MWNEWRLPRCSAECSPICTLQVAQREYCPVPSLTPSSVAGCGRLQLGLSIGLLAFLQLVDNRHDKKIVVDSPLEESPAQSEKNRLLPSQKIIVGIMLVTTVWNRFEEIMSGSELVHLGHNIASA